MKISQREARRLRKRVQELEEQDIKRGNAWVREFPGGVNIDTLTVSETEWHIVHTARLLSHACVLVDGDNSKLRVYALPMVPTGD